MHACMGWPDRQDSLAKRYGSMHARAQPLPPRPTLHAPSDQNSKELFPPTVQV
jgi:hypothetical protein